MSQRESFLLRVDARVLAAIRRWADDDLRSVNGQVEYLLRAALVESGRWPGRGSADQGPGAKGQGGAKDGTDELG